MSFTIALQRTAYTDNDTFNSAAFNAQSCLGATITDGQTYGFGLGALATPSICFTGDLNTGMWSPGNDTICFSTAAVERLRIRSDGLLTIGGTLTVYGLITATVGVTGSLSAPLSIAGSPSIAFAGDPDTGLLSPLANCLNLVTGGVDRLTISAAGLVTIGGALSVGGGITGALTGNVTGAVTGNVAGTLTAPLGAVGTPSMTFTGDLNTGLFSPGADQLALVTAGAQRLLVDAGGGISVTGDLAIGGELIVPLGAVGTPTMTFVGDLNTGIYSPGADQIALATAGVQRFIITAAGSVTIAGPLNVVGGVTGALSGNVTGSVTGNVSGNVTGSVTAPLGSVGSPSYSFSGDSNTGIFSPGGDQLTLVTAGASRLAVAAGGAITIPGTCVVNSGGGVVGQVRNINISTADPSGGADGDVWIKYT